MAAMSNATTTAQGFSVYQPQLGASLQWLPALGTQELDNLLDAYLPGPASIKDKRAAVAMDFFEFSRVTGQNFKYYAVVVGVADSVTSSPASSGMYDSGYASSAPQVNASPVMSEWSNSWNTASTTSSPSVRSASQFSNSSRRPTIASSSSSRRTVTDFSDLPGMKIMTKDGRDVTNSSSRGCKTKEQRDHAHLMRIMKACDACKKKKIRCDPSHRRAASSKPETPQQASRPVKKAPKAPSPPSWQPPPTLSQESVFTGASSQELDMLLFGDSPAMEPWDEFVQYEEQPAVTIPFDYDFFADPDGHFSPVSTSPVSSATSNTSPRQPQTPQDAAPPGVLQVQQKALPGTAVQEPALGYLDRVGPAHEYVDFNLYSPASSFADDELLVTHDIGAVYNTATAQSPIRSTGLAHSDGYGSSLYDGAAAAVVNPQTMPGIVDRIPTGDGESATARAVMNQGGMAGLAYIPNDFARSGDGQGTLAAAEGSLRASLTVRPYGGVDTAMRTVTSTQTSSSVQPTQSAVSAKVNHNVDLSDSGSLSSSSQASPSPSAAQVSASRTRSSISGGEDSIGIAPSAAAGVTSGSNIMATLQPSIARHEARRVLLPGSSQAQSSTVAVSPTAVVTTALTQTIVDNSTAVLASSGVASFASASSSLGGLQDQQYGSGSQAHASQSQVSASQQQRRSSDVVDYSLAQADLVNVGVISTLATLLAGGANYKWTSSTSSTWRFQSMAMAAFVTLITVVGSQQKNAQYERYATTTSVSSQQKDAMYQRYALAVKDTSTQWNILIMAAVSMAYIAVLSRHQCSKMSLFGAAATLPQRCGSFFGQIGDQVSRLSQRSGSLELKRQSLEVETQPISGFGTNAVGC